MYIININHLKHDGVTRCMKFQVHDLQDVIFKV